MRLWFDRRIAQSPQVYRPVGFVTGAIEKFPNKF
nr:MAG TPA: hypothetical protein [Caudoviricetes sp.]